MISGSALRPSLPAQPVVLQPPLPSPESRIADLRCPNPGPRPSAGTKSPRTPHRSLPLPERLQVALLQPLPFPERPTRRREPRRGRKRKSRSNRSWVPSKRWIADLRCPDLGPRPSACTGFPRTPRLSLPLPAPRRWTSRCRPEPAGTKASKSRSAWRKKTCGGLHHVAKVHIEATIEPSPLPASGAGKHRAEGRSYVWFGNPSRYTPRKSSGSAGLPLR